MDFAVLARGAEAARLVADFDFDAACGRAETHRIEGYEVAVVVGRLIHLEHGDRVEHLRLAVGDADHRPKQRGCGAMERGLERRGAAEDALDALDALVACALHQFRQHGRRREHGGEFAAREQFVRVSDIDATDQLDRGAGLEPRGREQRDPVRIGVHQQHAIVRAGHERQMRAQQFMRDPAPVVAVHDRLRTAGRARGHDGLAPGVRVERQFRRSAGRPRQNVLQHHHVEPECGDARQLAVLDHGPSHAQDTHRVGDIVRAEIEIDHELGRAARHHAVARGHHARAVARHDRDHFARLRARFDHGGAHGLRLRNKFRIGERAPARRDRDAVAKFRETAQRGSPGILRDCHALTLCG